ncbi:hypothetical protein ACIU0H_09630 [Pseudomonas aeruginosa]
MMQASVGFLPMTETMKAPLNRSPLAGASNNAQRREPYFLRCTRRGIGSLFQNFLIYPNIVSATELTLRRSVGIY